MKSSTPDLVSDLHKLIMRLKLIQWPLRSQRCVTPMLSQLAVIKNKLMNSQLLVKTLCRPSLRLMVSQTLIRFTQQAQNFIDENSMACTRQQSELFVRKDVPMNLNNTRSNTAIAPNKLAPRGKLTDEAIRKAINSNLQEIEVALNDSDEVTMTFEVIRSEYGTNISNISQDEVIKLWQNCELKIKLADELYEQRPDLAYEYELLKQKYISDDVILALQHYSQWEFNLIKLVNSLSHNMQKILSDETSDQNYFSKSSIASQSNLVRKSLLTTMIHDQLSDEKENSAVSFCSPIKIVLPDPLKEKNQNHKHSRKPTNDKLAWDFAKPYEKKKEKKSGTKSDQPCTACMIF